MPFPFVLSTTSHLTFQTNFISATHPSLPAVATSCRNVVRTSLKSHKRLPIQDQPNNFSTLVAYMTKYLKYLNTIDAALSGKTVSREEVDIALAKEVEIEWRPTLSSSAVPGREADRIKGKGLDYELHFVHHTLAILQILMARQSLLGLYASLNPTTEQRLAMIQNATKCLRSAYLLHSYLIQLSNASVESSQSFPPNAVDVSPATQSALQRLTAAEINLLAVLKDDPYPAILVQSRNDSDKEWMIKAPTIPKVRAQVLTRLCIGAAEHAGAANASLKSVGQRISKDLLDYTEDIRRTARARACRFQALDSDLAGQTGKALAWLHVAFNELGIAISSKEGSSKASKLDKLKSNWNERREDKRIAKAGPRWGIDGGKAEEIRILEYLQKKYGKENNTINIQIVPEWRPLLTMLPSGMNLPIEERWQPEVLAEVELSQMRAPPEEAEENGESSGEDDIGPGELRHGIAGAFPGTKSDYQPGSSYY